MTLLDVRDLTVRTADGRAVVDGAGWSLDPGGRLGIIGESGSGKSLTALALLGLVPEGMTVSGQVLLDGVDLLRLPARALRRVRGARIAMVFQEPLTALDPLMTIGRQLAGPLRLHRGLRGTAAREVAAELCRMVHLPEVDRVLASYPWQLSGGQRQRAGLALALACEPDVLLADEPTTALDVTVQAEILDLLDEVTERTGLALVFISHDLPVVARLAQDLVVMHDGAVLEHTTVRAALAGAEHSFTRRLITAARAVTHLPGSGS